MRHHAIVSIKLVFTLNGLACFLFWPISTIFASGGNTNDVLANIIFEKWWANTSDLPSFFSIIRQTHALYFEIDGLVCVEQVKTVSLISFYFFLCYCRLLFNQSTVIERLWFHIISTFTIRNILRYMPWSSFLYKLNVNGGFNSNDWYRMPLFIFQMSSVYMWTWLANYR